MKQLPLNTIMIQMVFECNLYLFDLVFKCFITYEAHFISLLQLYSLSFFSDIKTNTGLGMVY